MGCSAGAPLESAEPSVALPDESAGVASNPSRNSGSLFFGKNFDACEPQFAQSGNLLCRTNTKAAHRKGMVHPAQIQLDIHANTQVAYIDENERIHNSPGIGSKR